MKSLLSVSILLLLAAGCVSLKPAGVKRKTEHDAIQAAHLTCYSPPDSSYLFKATLDIKKHHLTGLLVIKQIESFPDSELPQGSSPVSPREGNGNISGTCRIVFVNEVGMTYFDLEMTAESFRVISSFDALNKKALINIFETDFRMLNYTGGLDNEKFFSQACTGNLVSSGKAGKYKSWRTYTPMGDTLLKTSAKSTIADPVMITYDKYINGFPSKIIIENPVIGLKLMLRKLSL
jgi:hypothetical protein